ncbi:hypothetical protein AURDEDRAFT_172004 [Auricularia subglabra TFB-10046 SS5]|nr:hypothetical protein AURDEDRAFT_172004 [Auricularia subglabra TFB-10046 SS5]
MAFTIRREAELYACLNSVLDEGFQYLQSADDVPHAISAILGLACRAAQEFSERWNDRRSKIQLPDELFAECFHHLDFTGRVVVSAVCRRWRSIALATPTLWSTIRQPMSSYNCNQLQELLLRSRACPLTVDLFLLPHQDLLLREHMWRVRSLTCIDPPSEESLSRPAPLLTSLVVSERHDHIHIPTDFGATSIRSMMLCRTSLPPVCKALENLSTLSAVFYRSCDLRRVFALCPRLINLTVTCVDRLADDATAVIQPLPASLVSLTVQRGGLGAMDYAGALRCWHTWRFGSLTLSHPTAIAGLVELFVKSHDRPWTLRVGAEFIGPQFICTASHADGEPAPTLTVTVPTQPNIHPLRECGAHLGRPVEVALSITEFFFFVLDAMPLPAVTSMTVFVFPDFWRIINRRMSTQAAPGMLAPCLRTLSFQCYDVGPGWLSEEILDWFFDVLPSRLREWITYDSPLLPRIALSGHITPEWSAKVQPARISMLVEELNLSLVERED